MSNDEFERDGCREAITKGKSAVSVPKMPVSWPQPGSAGAGSLCGGCNGWLLEQERFAGGGRVGLLGQGNLAEDDKARLRRPGGIAWERRARRRGLGTVEGDGGEVLPRQKMPGDVDFSCRTGAESFFMRASAPATGWGDLKSNPTAHHAYLRRPSLR